MDDEAKLLLRLQERKRKSSDASFDARMEVENRTAYARENAYRHPSTGRVEQMNFRLRAELKARIQKEIEDRNILSAVLFEEMWQAYLDVQGRVP